MQTWTSSFWLTIREFRRAFLLWAGVSLGVVQKTTGVRAPGLSFLFPSPVR